MLCLSALVFAGIGQAGAQHYIGIRGGYGSGTARFYPKPETGSVWGLYHGGVSWKFYTDEAFVGGVQADLLYMQQGFKVWSMGIDPENVDKRRRIGYYQRTTDAVMMPVMWQPHIYMFRQRLRIFMNAGITFSYVMSSKERTVDYQAETDVANDYEMKLTRDNRFGYGLVGGGGISYVAGRMEFFTEVRYYIGYSDILKRKTKYELNDYQRSPLDGLQIAAGIYFRLGKGAIRSTQGSGVNRDMARRLLEDAAKDDAPEDGAEAQITVEPEEKSRKERRREERAHKKSKDNGNDETAEGSEADTERR